MPQPKRGSVPKHPTEQDFDFLYTTTTGSFDITLLDWRADMSLTVWTGGELGLLYRNVDYRDQNRMDDYDANIIFFYWRQIIGAQ